MLKPPTQLHNKTYEQFTQDLDRLKTMRPREDDDKSNSGELLREIEAILMNDDYRLDMKCTNSKEYAKLWHEYANSVSDCDEVYRYIFEVVKLKDYRLYISYAWWIERYRRDFMQANGLFVEGLRSGLNDKIIADQYKKY